MCHQTRIFFVAALLMLMKRGGIMRTLPEGILMLWKWKRNAYGANGTYTYMAHIEKLFRKENKKEIYRRNFRAFRARKCDRIYYITFH